MELKQKDLVHTQELATVNADKFDVRRFNELYKMASGLRNVCHANAKTPHFTNLVGDVWSGFYKSAPQLKEVQEELAVNHALMEKLLADEDYQRQHEMTKLDDLLSTVTSINMSKELLNWVNNNQELQEQSKQFNNIKQREKRATQDIEKAAQQLANPALNEELKKEMEGLLKRAGKRLENAQQAEKQLQQEIVQAVKALSNDELQQMIQGACQQTTDTRENINQFVGDLAGSGNADYSRLPIREQFLLAELFQSNPKMREIAELAGRFKQIAKDKHKSLHKQSIARKGVTIGNEVERLLPSELANYLLPQAKFDFMKRFGEGQSLMFDKRGKSKLGRGPIICCIDESGSMRKLDTQSKAFLIALMGIARNQRRDFAVIPFSSTVGNIEVFPKGRVSVPQLVDVCSQFMGGGTVFEEPLYAAIQLIEKDRFKQADILFITDGESRVSETMLQEYQRIKEKKGFECTAVVIGNSVRKQVVAAFADKVVSATDLFAAADVFSF
ncbi:uncharacterized protein with von Willebrand factor type A (vWA) domain [Ureibacillus xyleni]|uniref:Uncharacterized protein with von Willebrand factor type A (VWA) domain n=1 Tax=Ureibacillus xyleni TaxID=614648 RepID=A0A285THF0_9BACL|nr:phosphate acyltransferase [Ureibacillus xyleni]SOC21579.1 uncharacterized protein with von Willebrand factor type A (vWA) domain [Ureibacillus xyleni]